MLPSKDAKILFREMAFAAASRWKERTNIRKSKKVVKGENALEIGKSNTRIENHFLRESNRPVLSDRLSKPILFPERIIKGNDLKEFPPNEIARRAGKPVARIETIPASGQQAEGIATGFLIAPNLLMTNFHVFPDSRSAEDCAANFLYERTISGINNGFQFVLDPAKFFITDKDLDFAIVYVEKLSPDNKFALTNFSFLNLYATPGKVINGQSINIIGYPDGGIKKYAFLNNTILDIAENEGFIHYTTDTEKGSSGSPAYNDSWEVSALHHSGIPLVINNQIIDERGNPWDEENQSDDEIQWIANEGINISKIVQKIKTIRFDDNEKQLLLDALIETTKDPLLMRPIANEINPSGNGNGYNQEIQDPTLSANQKNKDMLSITFNFYGNSNVFVGEPQGLNSPVLPGAPRPLLPSVSVQGIDGILEKKQNFDTDYDHRTGFDKDFLGRFNLGYPTVIPRREDELFMNFSNTRPQILHYHHFSIVMNKDRRLMMWSASNVDYNENKKSLKDRKEFGGEDWSIDPRIPTKFQITDAEFYKPATRVDRGHIVRREDNCWGDSELEIEYANADTYHWTNCTQQHELFNRAVNGSKGLWGMLENEVQNQLSLIDNRATIFAGPVLDNENDNFAVFNQVKIQYPSKFWKIVVVNEEQEGLTAYGFILDQSNVVNKFGLERLDFSQFRRQQATIQKITELTGVVFDSKVYNADILKDTPAFASGFRPFRESRELLLRRKKQDTVTV